MSTITCQSCGMQYDGSGLQPGVQFQCTQCGTMVQVGAPAPAVRRGPARPRGPVARGGRPMPAAAPAAAAPGQGPVHPAYGPPPKRGGGGAIIALSVVGVVLVVIVVAAVVFSSGHQAAIDTKQKEQQDMLAERQARFLKESAEAKRKSDELIKPLDAAMALGEPIAAAMREGNRTRLESLIDWQIFTQYNRKKVAENADFLNSPLIAEGEWAEHTKEDGTEVIRWVGKETRTAESLRQRVMDYIENYMFGSTDIYHDAGRSKAGYDRSGFSDQINGIEYVGVIQFVHVEGAGKLKQFWVAAPRGSTEAKVINFVDESAINKLQEKEAKRVKEETREFLREGYDPTRRGALGDGPREGEDPRREGEPTEDRDLLLPVPVKTGLVPTVPALVNSINELRAGKKLNDMRLGQVRSETSQDERKATFGAMIDLLIDAHKANDRNAKHNISMALYELWGNRGYEDWVRSKMVYQLGDLSTQDEKDIIIRRWKAIFDGYGKEASKEAKPE